jgi:polysaccharide export outer membrane protein
MYKNLVIARLVIFLLPVLVGQLAGQTPVAGSPSVSDAERLTVPPSTYVLGIGDQISIQGVEIDEITGKPVRVDAGGDLVLPMIGRFHAGGLTLPQLEAGLTARLKTYVREPSISVQLLEHRSQPVSIFGSVANPGVHQLEGRKTLVEMLSMAGGLKPEAGCCVTITRQPHWGSIPIPGARQQQDGTGVAEVPVRSLTAGQNPTENVLIMPHDVIAVPRADTVYVVGKVRRPGGILLTERANISVLQAISEAQGLDVNAAGSKARILRMTPGSTDRTEIVVNIDRIMAGSQKDIPLSSNDILFVPTNMGKEAIMKAVNAIVQTGSGVVVYRR